MNHIYKGQKGVFKVLRCINCKDIRKWFTMYVKMKNVSDFFPLYAIVILRSKEFRVLTLITDVLMSYWSSYDNQWLLLSQSQAQDYESPMVVSKYRLKSVSHCAKKHLSIYIYIYIQSSGQRKEALISWFTAILKIQDQVSFCHFCSMEGVYLPWACLKEHSYF